MATAIQSCLEPNPDSRAKNAKEVAAALPGGEPLAAAIAAGHMPTPDQVAASGGSGGMSVRMVTALMAAIMIGIVTVIVSSGSSVINQADLNKHPQILLEDAKIIVKAFGYNEPPIDYEWGLDLDRAANPNGQDESDRSATHLPQRRINFWYRHSPRVLTPISFRDGIRRNIGRVTYGDPPLVPGMARLILDASGRLLRFEGIPPATQRTEFTATDFPWSAFLEDTLAGTFGLTPNDFAESEPIFVPAVAYDQRRCWTANLSESRSIRVEAASSGKHVVYLQVDRAGIKSESTHLAPARRAVLYPIHPCGLSDIQFVQFRGRTR